MISTPQEAMDYTPMNKTIIIKWVITPNTVYDREMKVIHSTHPRFVEGYRFDYGFANISSNEGYTIVILPVDDDPIEPDEEWTKEEKKDFLGD